MTTLSKAQRPTCRFCKSELNQTFVDLGMSPLCQTHIEPHQLNMMEPFYPLHAYVCGECFLVQLDEYVSPSEIFSDYAYFSSYSDTMVEHARQYCDKMSQLLSIDSSKKVFEVASNDGYLLQHFVARGVPVLGIEPAANVAQVAIEKGVKTTVRFMGEESASEIVDEHGQADLVLGNNVLAHVPDINDFVKGLRRVLKPTGTITMEFPHLYRLMERNQFDTIYHEHFSYLSFITVERIFAEHGLVLFDVEQLPIHGGSLRIYARHADDTSRAVGSRAKELRERELSEGFAKLETYTHFEQKVMETKRKILEFLIRAKRDGKRVVGYGAPGKGNTLLNYCGIRTDFLDFTVDRSPHKHGRYTPGTRIPILHPDAVGEAKPDYLFILVWNIKDEVMKQMAHIREWGGQFVVPIPELQVYA